MLDRLRSLPQPLRFLLAGGLAAAINWSARFPLASTMGFLPAVAAATAIGMGFGFVTYRLLVFPGSPRRVSRQLRDFVLVNAASLLVVVAAAALFRRLLLPLGPEAAVEPAAHALAIAAGAVVNYLGHSSITFRRRRTRL